MSIREIARKYHISRINFSKYLKENNYEIWKQDKTSRKYYCNFDFFECIDTEEKAYWLGFLYADGYIIKHNYNNIVGLNLKVSDR